VRSTANYERGFWRSTENGEGSRRQLESSHVGTDSKVVPGHYLLARKGIEEAMMQQRKQEFR
jgi:hypothetical protein